MPVATSPRLASVTSDPRQLSTAQDAQLDYPQITGYTQALEYTTELTTPLSGLVGGGKETIKLALSATELFMSRSCDRPVRWASGRARRGARPTHPTPRQERAAS